MKVIIHIGVPKTGTTTIQEFLYRNQHHLAEDGYHFMQSIGIKNHRDLAMLFYDNSKLKRKTNVNFEKKYELFFSLLNNKSINNDLQNNIRNNFEEEINSLDDNIHTVIISSEDFSSKLREREEINNFYSFLSFYFSDIKIISYLREQGEYAMSAYSTAIKMNIQIPPL